MEEEARVEIEVFVETEVREVQKSGAPGCADIEDTPGRKYSKGLSESMTSESKGREIRL